jgi:tRNA threonylcarbamoyladenosine biosynthesis protein TsaE
MRKFISNSPSQTEKIGKKITQFFLSQKSEKIPNVIILKGDLGGGKTTFLKGFAKGLGIKEKILSPTFVLIKKFDIKNRTSNFKHFYHIDCYRIKKEKEILNLGFREMIKDPKNLVAIEWAERIEKILPKNVFEIIFKILGKRKREILIKWKNF